MQYNFHNLKFSIENNNKGYPNFYSIICAGSVNGSSIMTEFSHLGVLCVEELFLQPNDRCLAYAATTGGNHAVWTSVASSDRNRSDCIVAAITFNTSQLAFGKPSVESWTFQQMKDDEDMAGIKFHEDGKLYVIGWKTCMEYIAVFDPLEVLHQGKGKSAFMSKRLLIGRLLSEHSRGERHYPSFTWSFIGELLLLWELVAPFVYKVLVFRLDTSSSEPKCVNMRGQM